MYPAIFSCASSQIFSERLRPGHLSILPTDEVWILMKPAHLKMVGNLPKRHGTMENLCGGIGVAPLNGIR